MGKQDDNVAKAVEILRAGGPMMAGALGYELWGAERTIRTENTVKTMYARAAGKLLRRAKAMGLVRDEQRGVQHLWFAKEV